jgi:rod shape-determining protein MreD
MIRNEREPRWTMALTVLIALVIQVIPLPEWLTLIRPPFLVLAVIYWSIASPRAGGIFVAFASGVILDVFKGTVLGQHALAISLIAYIVIKLHQRLRNQPLVQQSLFVFAMLAIYEAIIMAIDGWAQHSVASNWRWAHPFVGAGLWPLAALLLGRTHPSR